MLEPLHTWGFDRGLLNLHTPGVLMRFVKTFTYLRFWWGLLEMYISKVFMGFFFRTVHTWGFDEGVSCGRDIHTQGSSYWYEDNARCTSDKLKRNTNVLGKNSVSLQEPNSRSINWFVKLRSKYITSVRKWIQILDLQWSQKNPLYSVNPQNGNAYELKYFLIDYQSYYVTF